MSISSLEFNGLFDNNSGQMNYYDGSNNGKDESSIKGENHGTDNAMSMMPVPSLEFISLFNKDGQMKNGSKKSKVASKTSKGVVKIPRRHCNDNGGYGYSGDGGYDAEGYYYYYGGYGGGYDDAAKSGKGSYGYGGGGGGGGGGGSGNSSDKEKILSGGGSWGFGKVVDGSWRHDDVGNDAQYKYRAQQFHLRRKN